MELYDTLKSIRRDDWMQATGAYFLLIIQLYAYHLQEQCEVLLNMGCRFQQTATELRVELPC